MEYSTDTLLAEPPPNPGQPVYELSGWWLRAGAEIVDGIIAWMLAGALLSVISLVTIGMEHDDTYEIIHFVIELVVRLAAATLVFGVIMGITGGQTVGMKVTSIRVVREDGEPIGMGFALYRQTLVKTILFSYIAAATLFIATILNYLWPLWDKKNQALHDKICKTRVVRHHSAKVAPLPVPPGPLGGPPPPPPPLPPPPPPPVPPVPSDSYKAPEGFENPVPED